MPTYLTKPVALDGIGFIGTDTFAELPDDVRAQLVCRVVVAGGIRIVLAARRCQAAAVRAKVARGERLRIATSYPRLAKRCEEKLGVPLSVYLEIGGSVEAAPELVPAIDGIIEIVDSGKTLEDNRLAIIEDDLVRLNIAAIWRTGS